MQTDVRLRRLFADFKVGDVVTGTVHWYGLDGQALCRRGVLEQVNQDYVLRWGSPPRKRRGRR